MLCWCKCGGEVPAGSRWLPGHHPLSRPQPAERNCRACGEVKPSAEFHGRKCKACKATEAAERRRAADPEVMRERQARYHRNRQARGTSLERLLRSLARSAAYLGINPEDVFAEYRKTGNRCQSCGQMCSWTARVRIDHCHETNTFRGLLCDGCNKAAGFLGDSPERALQLAAYLERHLDRLTQRTGT